MSETTEKKQSAAATIAPVTDGPLVVKNPPPLYDWTGDAYPKKNVLSLCRCGASHDKPYCDGSHKKIGFTSACQKRHIPDHDDAYEGKHITIHDNRAICSHAGICTETLKSVWRMGIEPWIDPDGAKTQDIINVIQQCPSGALRYTLKNKASSATDHGTARITVSKDGPFHVEGAIDLQTHEQGQWGKGADKRRYALCRCGASTNKPFCDGSHWYKDFQDDDATLSITHRQPTPEETRTVWYKVADKGSLPEGRVRTVTAGKQTIALTHFQGQYGALKNRCPHQGGPLGEGSIEKCYLRCPWHGWDFDPINGKARKGSGYDDVAAYPVECRDDGIYVAVQESLAMPRTISNVMVETMVAWGVRHVFGMVGHSNLGLADAIRIEEEKGRLTFIGIRHEGAAAFACSAYGKLSGKPAACLTIAGPGATNLLTGLWDAHIDRAPLLALTGQVNTQVLGPGAFQEIDQSSAFEAVAPFNHTVLHTSRHADLMSLAMKNAIVRRDVAHLIFPDEVQNIPADKKSVASSPRGRIARTHIAPDERDITEATYRIGHARRPVIILGHGVARDSMDDMRALADKINAPIMTSFKAKGIIPDSDPLAAGVLGRSGTPIASWLMNESDLIIAFGASFSDHTGIDKSKPIIQVDFDRMALAKFHPVTLPIWGDIRTTAQRLLNALPQQTACIDQRQDIKARWALWREEKKRRGREDNKKGVNAAALFDVLSRHIPHNAVIAVDVGNNTYSFGRYFECTAQTILMSGYLGSIGFSFPAAMGAWAYEQTQEQPRPIISISGDGGLGQYLAEFTTAVKYRMAITHILLNNNELGKISKEQRDGRWDVWQTSLHNPDFAQFATQCGGKGIRVDRIKQLDNAMRDALASSGPALIDIVTDPMLI
ncbi:MAG: CDGSH iron-sulfur domain-containing protein [Alphaproteobacteria bacterium GM7ARS4]|nr:CDGSH iron-sulfur domain-containing protein [Alphaproteobacteria bacterium GM7ARS4]